MKIKPVITVDLLKWLVYFYSFNVLPLDTCPRRERTLGAPIRTLGAPVRTLGTSVKTSGVSTRSKELQRTPW
jgi:hypothetical protein